ncbi:LysR family transcriptional regulator [Amylibacter sp.]|jgi:DNA-binding transcriptional LysR family regulator|nr:LysR family transcriptional regulator [Amylibacter sp.]MDA9269521.1 LysR family transcriptional regulator [Amylibacter sp.]MDA9308145.1 LysR family transcriptional regulator [Amylibacter sp.]MDA9324726.1 LysR family transcriptional regulator [Amylibacter sp.]MDA9534451.1 LysR family transcriptional regulator [Amylibacter sp.]|tara:strand:+ start:1031 stop:1885 length:855 start_codon:yes stop_codon:yes gene_type:complete
MDNLVMVKALPPLAWFRAFESAARRLSFTAAAEEIGMTQSAVSQHVKSLETSLGVALFIRRARGLSLTDDGRKLLPQVSSALETLTVAARNFDTVPSKNVLTVAASVSVAQWLISPRLKEFTNKNPEINIRFLSTIWPDDFHTVRADVEIPFGSQKQFGRNATRLEPSGLVTLKSPKFSGTIESSTLIESVGTSDGWKLWAESFGGNPLPKIFVDSYGAAMNLAISGNGIALVSNILAQDAIRSGKLVMADKTVLSCNEGYYLRFNDKNPLAKQFHDWLINSFI